MENTNTTLKFGDLEVDYEVHQAWLRLARDSVLKEILSEFTGGDIVVSDKVIGSVYSKMAKSNKKLVKADLEEDITVILKPIVAHYILQGLKYKAEIHELKEEIQKLKEGPSATTAEPTELGVTTVDSSGIKQVIISQEFVLDQGFYNDFDKEMAHYLKAVGPDLELKDFKNNARAKFGKLSLVNGSIKRLVRMGRVPEPYIRYAGSMKGNSSPNPLNENHNLVLQLIKENRINDLPHIRELVKDMLGHTRGWTNAAIASYVRDLLANGKIDAKYKELIRGFYPVD